MGQAEPGQFKMQIVNVIEEARIGGPQKRILSVGKELQKDGIWTVVVTTGESSEAFKKQSADAGIELQTIEIVRLRQSLSVLPLYAVTFIRDVLRYRRMFKKANADVVHTNGASQWKPAIAAKLLGIPLVWHLNDTRCPTPVRLPFRVFSKLCATGYLVSSERTREVYLQPHETKPVVLARPPVENNVFNQIQKTRGNPLVVTSVGNLNPDKDILTFIRLAQKAYGRFGKNIKFKIAGRRLDTQPAYNARIETQLAEAPHNIEFLGYCGDVPGLLNESDIFVCTSRSEAGPMSVFEAFAAGLPVITTDVGDVRDICREHGVVAAVAPVSDVEALYGQLTGIVDENRFAEFADAGEAFAKGYLDVAQCARSHFEIYKIVRG